MPFKQGEIQEGAVLFKPGQSGNPNGHPKGQKNRSTIARKILEMRGMLPAEKMAELKAKFPEIKNNMTVEEVMTIVMAENAIMGEDKHYRAIMDSAYGAPKQEIDQTVKGDIILHITNNDAKLGE